MMAEYGVLAVTLSKRQSAVLVAPDGTRIAFLARDERGIVQVFTVAPLGGAARPEACVVSPDGRAIAFVRPVGSAEGTFNQVFVVEVPR